MAWTKKHRKAAAAIVRRIAEQPSIGNISELAKRLGEDDRAVVANWISRGSVPLEKIDALLRLDESAQKPAPSQLNARGHLLERQA